LTKRESPQPKPNATLSQEGLSLPELDTDLQYKEAHSNATLSQEGLSLPELNTDLQYKEAHSNATLSQEGPSLPELDTDLQYKEAYPKKPSATQLTDQVPLNTEVTALAHLPVRLWMTQNPTESSVSRLTIQVPLTTEVTNPVSTKSHKENSTIICRRTMMPGKVYGR
jgi:hypothetical protein